MSLLSAYQIATAVVLSMMLSLWLCSLAARDVSIVDRFWGMGYVLIAWALAAVKFSSLGIFQWLLLSIVTIWGLRLSIYIHLRNRGHEEDYRYQEMRQKNGKKFWWYSLFSVFGLQGVLMLLIAMPIIFVLAQDGEEGIGTGIFSAMGTVVWLLGFIFEAGGDFQLSQFKKNPANKGKLLTTGLWSLTRHPNYFGDACQWWGFGLFAFAFAPQGILTFIGPIVMTIFIRKISGVDLLEKSLKSNKPGYAEYIARTPAFVPRISHRGR